MDTPPQQPPTTPPPSDCLLDGQVDTEDQFRDLFGDMEMDPHNADPFPDVTSQDQGAMATNAIDSAVSETNSQQQPGADQQTGAKQQTSATLMLFHKPTPDAVIDPVLLAQSTAGGLQLPKPVQTDASALQLPVPSAPTADPMDVDDAATNQVHQPTPQNASTVGRLDEVADQSNLPPNPPAQAVSFRYRLQWFAAIEDPTNVSDDEDDIVSESGGHHPSSYYTKYPRPAAWGPMGCSKPLFRYSTRGQWSAGSYFSTEELRFYVAACPRNLKIWIQSLPHDHKRQDDWDLGCRWAQCPDKGRPIKPGFFRCTFDEYSDLTSDSLKDPYFVAGCLHLHCFEQIFDVAKLYRRGRLGPDDRPLPYEGTKTNFAINKHHNKRIIESAFEPWILRRPETNSVPAHEWKPLPHCESLSYALTAYHVDNCRSDFKPKCNASHMTIPEHMGDLKLSADYSRDHELNKRQEIVSSGFSAFEPPREVQQVTSPIRRGSLEVPKPKTKSSTRSRREENIHDIEKITAERVLDGRKFYRVKWEGYKDKTWEPEENLLRDLGRGNLRKLFDFPDKESSRLEKQKSRSRASRTSGDAQDQLQNLRHELDLLRAQVVDRAPKPSRKRKRSRVEENESESEGSADESEQYKRATRSRKRSRIETEDTVGQDADQDRDRRRASLSSRKSSRATNPPQVKESPVQTPMDVDSSELSDPPSSDSSESDSSDPDESGFSVTSRSPEMSKARSRKRKSRDEEEGDEIEVAPYAPKKRRG